MNPHRAPNAIVPYDNSGDGFAQYPMTEATDYSGYSKDQPEYYQQFNGENWDHCYNCRLVFSSFNEANNHFSNVCPGLWCERCQVTFKTPQAREDHFTQGCAHWLCGVCDFDGVTVDAQESHWKETKHRYECRGCTCWYERRYWDKHLRTYHACRRCHKHHDSAEQRRNHELEHTKEAGLLQCIGRCSREFATFGEMYVHLESGLCESSIENSDVLRCFAIHQGAEYLLVRDRKAILKKIFEGGELGINLFKCPGNGCEENFRYFSSFLKHGAGKKCAFAFKESGPDSMLVHMENNLFLDVVIPKIKKMAEDTNFGIQVLPLTPEHPRNRLGAIIPDTDALRPYFHTVVRCFHVCLKEIVLRPSNTVKKPGTLRVRIPKSFKRLLGALERNFHRATQAYMNGVTTAPHPHGDILIYYQATKKGEPAWKFLGDMHKVVQVLRVIYDFESPRYEKYY
ncbi:hypothetical protein TWF718_001484 [Orbilia javanica]|uniref:C2H2-type domain-containing protein n=1 Tax=Orbilia javanica TaxID=47235 RepID=A0AAN8NDX2_9PEZI